MRAKCPKCANGCPQCEDGFVVAAIASGTVHRRVCGDCGRGNGGRVVAPDLPPPEPKPARCPWCRSDNTRWHPPLTVEAVR